MSKQHHESAYFNDYDLKPICFQIEDIKYDLDLKYMIWKTEMVQEQNVEGKEEDQHKKKNNKQFDVKKIYETNKKQITDLQNDIAKLHENIQKYQEKLNSSQAEQQQLIDQYVHEHLETEKVKAARERLDKLKKELGL